MPYSPNLTIGQAILTYGLFFLFTNACILFQRSEKCEVFSDKMDEIEIFSQLGRVEQSPALTELFDGDAERARTVAEHLTWLRSIRHELPSPARHYKIGIYIRYFNQTKYENYLSHHKALYRDTIALCPNWELVDFYVDEGSSPPHMESAREWCRLLNDCYSGKVDLIFTQKMSNVSKKVNELSFCARILAAHTPPIGIYFISEDMFTLASYYQNDLHDPEFFPSPDWQVLPDTIDETRTLQDG